MIYVTGDTHGDWKTRLNKCSFPEQEEMTKDDYVIVLGDFGIWDDSDRERRNLDWLNNRNFTTLFISGNHSNYDILNALPVKQWNGGNVNFIRSNVIHLRRGQVFDIDGIIFFSFGGASSHDISDGILEIGDPRIKTWKKDSDKMFRINHKSWWKEELPSKEEMQEGINNLVNHNGEVDFILTHCASSSTAALLSAGLYKPDILTSYFEQIRMLVDYKKWLFGHYHDNKAINDREILLYDQIVRIA